MKRLILAVLFMVPTLAFSESVESFRVGDMLNHMVSLCVSKDHALAVFRADVDGGFEKAKELWNKFDDCAGFPVYAGPKVGRIVATGTVVRDGKKVKASVVEILHPETKLPVAYFLTTLPVYPAGREV
jgi:hypothetical protein